MSKEIILRDYQIECKSEIKKRFDQGINRQLIVEATGLGKRIQAVDLMRHFKRSLFIAHREELIIQAYDEINDFMPMSAGIVKGNLFEIDKKVVVASVQTLYNRTHRIDPDMFDLIVIDEAHHYVSKTYLSTIRHFSPRLLTAWTATPKRLDGLSLTNIVDEIVFEYRIENGIKDGYLAPIEAYQVQTQTDLSKVRRTAGDFNQKDLSEAVDSELRNNLIAGKYLQYSGGSQGIAFCVDIDHCYNLARVLNNNNIKAEAVVSDTTRCPHRQEIVSAFQAGEIDVLTNVNILTEGFDYSDVGVVMMARPTQSETLYIQSIGRGTRLKSDNFVQKYGRDNCIILDFVDNTAKHSLVNAWTLEEDKPIEERMFVPQKHKQKLIEARERRIAKIQQEKREKDLKINLLVLPKVRIWDSEKMLEPATEAQMKWIRDLGVYQEDVEYTKAMASELISSQPAKWWQINYLRDNGYDVSNGATLGQYQKVKWRIDNENKFVMSNSQKP